MSIWLRTYRGYYQVDFSTREIRKRQVRWGAWVVEAVESFRTITIDRFHSEAGADAFLTDLGRRLGVPLVRAEG